MSEKIEIRKGGKLIETYWHYDKEAEEGSYKERDLTEKSIRYLFEPCQLADDVTLKDIFTLLNNDIDIFDAVIGNWCKEIVTEGLTQPEKPYTGEYDPQGMEFLELYWMLGQDKEITYGNLRPDLHAIGYELQEDQYEGTGESRWVIYKKGDRIPWSVSFQKTNDLINLPLKLKKDYIITNENLDAPRETYGHEVFSGPGLSYSLGQILYGVIWELSFHGGPASRDQKDKELHEAYAEALAHPENLVSIDKLFEDSKDDDK